MIISITSTTPDATDLGYLLHKHPQRLRSVKIGPGTAHVFYPEATPERCTATLMVEVDPVKLSRGEGRRQPTSLEPYVNDRPYVASSLLSVALQELYGSAMAGKSGDSTRPELGEAEIDLSIDLPVVPVRGGEDFLRRVFEPLDWQVEATPIANDDTHPEWGDSLYLAVKLTGTHTVQRALEHLYVLMPVLDRRKHYFTGDDEVEKLIRRGGEWLQSHPEAKTITRRYLKFGGLVRQGMARLAEAEAVQVVEQSSDSGGAMDVVSDQDSVDVAQNNLEAHAERPLSLNRYRMDAVVEAVNAAGGGRVIDLGCGEGQLLKRLVAERSVTAVAGVDVSAVALDRAERRLRVDELSERRREKLTLFQGALTYTDTRFHGYDVACVVEVIEHLDPERLDTFARVLFDDAAPSTVIVTTPNAEFNVNYPGIEDGRFRHGDHRFEWTRTEFAQWVESINTEFGYRAEITTVGPVDEVVGPSTQMVVFSR